MLGTAPPFYSSIGCPIVPIWPSILGFPALSNSIIMPGWWIFMCNCAMVFMVGTENNTGKAVLKWTNGKLFSCIIVFREGGLK